METIKLEFESRSLAFCLRTWTMVICTISQVNFKLESFVLWNELKNPMMMMMYDIEGDMSNLYHIMYLKMRKSSKFSLGPWAIQIVHGYQTRSHTPNSHSTSHWLFNCFKVDFAQTSYSW